MWSIVVCEFYEQEKCTPIILLKVNVHSEILLECLINVSDGLLSNKMFQA